MSLLGKILAFLNILGVGGFIALASMTYAKRHAWEYANFRHDLLVDGLPLDDQDANRAGEPLVNKFGADDESRKSDRTLKELFPAAPGPVATQVAEVTRVYQQLKAKLDESGDNLRQKNLLLAQILLALAGNHRQPEIYVDREFYLSMQAQLADDDKYAAFKKALSDALPVAVAAMRFDTKKLSFPKEFQQALASQPGDDRWKLAEAFLIKLPNGVSFDQAADKAKLAAEAAEDKAKKLHDAETKLDDAKKVWFVAITKSKSEPTKENKQAEADAQKAVDAAQDNIKPAAAPFEVAKGRAVALAEAEAALKNAKTPDEIQKAKKALDDAAAADEAARRDTDPRTAGAIAFLQAIRKDDKKTRVNEFVADVVTETVAAVNEDLSARFEQAYHDALSGGSSGSEASQGETNKMIRERRRQAIARFLLAGIEVLDDKFAGTPDLQIADVQLYRRFISVVGVKWAVRAVNMQQAALVGVVDDLNRAIAAERATFRNLHQEKILSLRRRAEEIDRLAMRLQEISDQANTQVTIAKGEKDRVDQYVVDLKGSRGETAKEMETLTKLTDGLDQVRKDIRDAIRSNDLNLRKIAQLEEEVLYYQQKLVEKEKVAKDKKKRKTTTP